MNPNPWPFVGVLCGCSIAAGAVAVGRHDWPMVVGDAACLLLSLAIGVLIARENRR